MTPFSATGRPIIIISFLIRPVVDQQAIMCIIWHVIFLSDYRSIFFLVSSYSIISINISFFFFFREVSFNSVGNKNFCFLDLALYTMCFSFFSFSCILRLQKKFVTFGARIEYQKNILRKEEETIRHEK